VGSIATALGDDARVATVVTGGQVDQIINIARLGVLSLTVKRYFYVFRTIRQVIAFLAIIVLVGAGIAFGVWRAAQPEPFPVDSDSFNIAVAEFAEIPESPNPAIAPIVSSQLFNFLDSTYRLDEFGLKVRVRHEKIGIIHGPAEAESLARLMNAQLVVYGDVAVAGEEALVTPKFYVANAFRTDTNELTGPGQYQLEYPYQFPKSDLLPTQSPVNTVMRQRASILIEFTKALVYRNAQNYTGAFGAIQKAISEADGYGNFNGKETLYLYGAEITRLSGNLVASQQYVSQSLVVNSTYARAYIAQANIYYDQHDFESAAKYYEQATQLSDQPYGAHIMEKANLGLGNIYVFQYQNQPGNPALADLALSHYTIVTDTYQRMADPYIKGLAAWAYYGSGIVFQYRGDTARAIQAFEQTLALTDDLGLKTRAQGRLDKMR
jgi:tetratricopeptide (TPR) repeat protein